MVVTAVRREPNAQGKRRRSTEGAQGTNKGHKNGEAMALVGVRLTAQLGRTSYLSKMSWCASRRLMRKEPICCLASTWGFVFGFSNAREQLYERLTID